jgi:(p)ppGpp synthase/HD superfamily hydrolase
MSLLIPRARDFALKAHDGLVTKTYGGFTHPKILHIEEVAVLTWASGGTDEEVAAAWLHDTIEDTETTQADIVEHFGKEVAALVDGLTDPLDFKELPVRIRKTKQAERIKPMSASVKRVKIADQTSNIHALAVDPTLSMTPDELKGYLEGARKIVEACRGASPFLEKLFDESCLEAEKQFKTLS